MATLTGQNLTLLDILKRTDPDGGSSALAEMLSQENEILTDMPWVEGNLPTGHRVSIRTGLPSAVWRKYNQGVPSSKSTTAQVDEACGNLEALGQVDVDLANLNGNTAGYRMQENSGFVEALNQEFASTLLYNDLSPNPEKFLGLAPRYSRVGTPSATIPETADNVIDGGGTGSTNSSIWLIGWAAGKIYGVYPKGSKGGLAHRDMGEDWAFDTTQNRYRAYLDKYQWQCGLVVQDWRYAVRICNVDVATLTKNAATGADVIDLMTRALERIKSLSGVTPAFYANRTIRSFLRRQTVNKVAAGTLAYDNVGGKPTLSFAEVPVRRVDALLSTEARIV